MSERAVVGETTAEKPANQDADAAAAAGPAPAPGEQEECGRAVVVRETTAPSRGSIHFHGLIYKID